jgi:hypothetical protein
MSGETDPQVEPQVAPQAEAPLRPEGLPENFSTVGDLVNSYNELRTKLSTKAPAEAPAEVPQIPAVDFESYSTEYTETGQLSEETYAALEAGGIPKSMVDSYIAGQEAQGRALAQDTFNIVGGEERYSEMVKWAVDNLDQTDIESFNRTLASGDKAAIRMAVLGVHSQYSNGLSPSMLKATGAAGSTSGAFRSDAEMKAAMLDPKYGKDPEYTRSVQDRVRANRTLWAQ